MISIPVSLRMLNDKNWNYATGLVLNDILTLLGEAAQADVAYLTVPQATDSGPALRVCGVV